ncbi:MAG: hypothetical protein AAF493_01625 [Pseudomonadota bacterium]
MVGAISLVGCDSVPPPDPTPTSESSRVQPVVLNDARSLEQRIGTRFSASSWEGLTNIGVERIRVPPMTGGGAIWGSLGVDDRGHAWLGVSANEWEQSAQLYELDTGGELHARGRVSDALAAAKLPEGATQNKIHTKLHQADDGYLYFASTDETDENFASDKPPRWGGHLWRIKPGSAQWEHVLSVPEGIVALNAVGRWVYVLGYWNHVLYQFDVATRRHRRVVVGSACGHVSRNFLVDLNGSAYVPRITSGANDRAGKCESAEFIAELVEIEPDQLAVAGTTPLSQYFGPTSPSESHGIVSYTGLNDSSFLFVTHAGAMYHLLPLPDTESMTLDLGFLHPDGEAYVPSLYSPDGEQFVVAVGRTKGGELSWIRRDLKARRAEAEPLPDAFRSRGQLLYGSMARLSDGTFLVAGRRVAVGLGQPDLVLIKPGRAN